MLLVLSLLMLGQSSNAQSPTIVYEQVRPVLVSDKESQYPDLIRELNECENYGRWDDNVIQDGLTKSYCGLMFKEKTFLHEGHESGILPEWVDETNFEKYICDKDIIVPIAEYMIKKGLGPTAYGWTNCWRKNNLSQYL
jgi:hypothetical protein